jgi:hypothetical protein
MCLFSGDYLQDIALNFMSHAVFFLGVDGWIAGSVENLGGKYFINLEAKLVRTFSEKLIPNRPGERV